MMCRACGSVLNQWVLRQSLRLFGGGGGNRKHPISGRSRQLQVITGNPIPSYRNRNTRKSTFGKTLCQLAKSNPRSRREGRTWERRPPPRPWARWRARFFRARGTPNRVSWRGLSCGSSHIGGAPSDDRVQRSAAAQEEDPDPTLDNSEDVASRPRAAFRREPRGPPRCPRDSPSARAGPRPF